MKPKTTQSVKARKVRSKQYNTDTCVSLRLVALETGLSYGTVRQYAQRPEKAHIIEASRQRILDKIQK